MACNRSDDAHVFNALKLLLDLVPDMDQTSSGWVNKRLSIRFYQSINQSNLYNANIPGESMLSGTTAKSVFNSKIEKTAVQTPRNILSRQNSQGTSALGH